MNNFLRKVTTGLFGAGSNQKVSPGGTALPVTHTIFSGVSQIFSIKNNTKIPPTAHNNIAHRTQFE